MSCSQVLVELADMSDNTSAEATITEQQETSADEEVFDVFETGRSYESFLVFYSFFKLCF